MVLLLQIRDEVSYTHQHGLDVVMSNYHLRAPLHCRKRPDAEGVEEVAAVESKREGGLDKLTTSVVKWYKLRQHVLLVFTTTSNVLRHI